MTDVLIRDVPADTLRRIEAGAARLGLSRNEYLRREMGRLAARETPAVTLADFERLADVASDLEDDTVMGQAWS